MTKVQKYAMAAGAALVLVWWVQSRARAAVQAVDPTNDDNLFNSAFNRLTGAITGDEERTLGVMLADWIHEGEPGWK